MSQLSFDGNPYIEFGRLQAENAALKEQVAQLEDTRAVLHESYIRHLAELDSANKRLVHEESLRRIDSDAIEKLRQQLADMEDEVGYQSQWKSEFRSQLEYSKQQLTTLQSKSAALVDALTNCHMLAARHRKEEWAQHIIRFCKDSVSTSPLRDAEK